MSTCTFVQGITMTKANELLERIIDQCGGLGRFQALAIAVFVISKGSVTWSTMMMAFGGAVPDWWCLWNNQSASQQPENDSFVVKTFKSCSPQRHDNVTSTEFSCLSREFATDKWTVVSEWHLVCDADWVTASITTIQMGGLLVSGVLSGQLGDTIGRKTTFYLSLGLLVVCNIISPFSVSWQMFAAIRFFIGMGCGSFLTVSYTFVIEFIPTKYRPMIMAIPIWPVSSAVYALIAWWLHDWQYVHYATVAYTLPVMITALIMPESFRWLVSHNKLNKAENVINKMASINGKETPDLVKLFEVIQEEEKLQEQQKHYTILDMFKSRELIKKTVVIAVTWFSCGYGYYAISFGVDDLSGSLYLNMFLLSMVEIPSQVLTWYFNNCIGRQKTCLLFSLISGVGGLAVGIVQVTDIEMQGLLVNVFAMTSKLGVAAAWAAFQIFTIESYPTVVRNLGYGVANSASRVGAMIAPQMIFVSKKVPGIMYFLCGGLMILTAFSALLLPETKGKALEDMIHNDKTKERNENGIKVNLEHTNLCMTSFTKKLDN